MRRFKQKFGRFGVLTEDPSGEYVTYNEAEHYYRMSRSYLYEREDLKKVIQKFEGRSIVWFMLFIISFLFNVSLVLKFLVGV